MKKIEITNAAQMTSPNPFTLVCTETPEGKTNLAAVSWWTYVSFNPAMLCVAMNKTSYSGEIIRKNKSVVLAMPGSKIGDAAFRCGTVSGRDNDKAQDFGIELAGLPECAIKVPVETRLAFDCILENIQETGSHYLYICTIKGIYADESKEQVFAWDGYATIRPL